MAGLYAMFQTDKTLETDGIILDYGFNSKGNPIQFRVARAGGSNLRFTKRMEHKVKPFRQQIKNEQIESELVKKLMKECYAETVVIGWEGVEDQDGNDLQFSVENCMKVFDDLPDLFADIQEQCQKSVLFRAHIAEDASKN